MIGYMTRLEMRLENSQKDLITSKKMIRRSERTAGLSKR